MEVGTHVAWWTYRTQKTTFGELFIFHHVNSRARTWVSSLGHKRCRLTGHFAIPPQRFYRTPQSSFFMHLI